MKIVITAITFLLFFPVGCTMINQLAIDVSYKVQRTTVDPKNIPPQFPILVVWETEKGLQANTFTYQTLKQKEKVGALPNNLRFNIQESELNDINGQLFERSRYWRPTATKNPQAQNTQNEPEPIPETQIADTSHSNHISETNHINDTNPDNQTATAQSQPEEHHAQPTAHELQQIPNSAQPDAWATNVKFLDEIKDKQITLLVSRTDSENEINKGWYKVTKTGWLPQYHLQANGLNPNYYTMPISIVITTLLWLAHRARLRRIARRRQAKNSPAAKTP